MSKNEDHIADLKETIVNLRAACLKLNPKKCVFGVSRGKMLGVHHRTQRHKGKPRKVKGHNLNSRTINEKGNLEAY